jgi:Aerobic-type carbon monoxide dehydrogenase, small subunit CoxS/CutS homologs
MTACMQATLVVNGAPRRIDAEENRILLDILRNELGLKGTRFGCGQGECGACMVLLDGRAVPSCDMPLWAADGKDVVTVEGLSDHPVGALLQAAFVRRQAAQCGYCTAGLLAAATALLADRPTADEATIREALDRNLCRCGAHNRVVQAVIDVATQLRGANDNPPRGQTP